MLQQCLCGLYMMQYEGLSIQPIVTEKKITNNLINEHQYCYNICSFKVTVLNKTSILEKYQTKKLKFKKVTLNKIGFNAVYVCTVELIVNDRCR